MTVNNFSNTKKVRTRQQNRMLFYVLMFGLPLLQFLIFYIYVNFNSLIIAVQERQLIDGNFEYSFTTDNFKRAFTFFFGKENGRMMLNSLQLLAGQIVIATPLALLFSYYIAKGKIFSSFFRIMLYLPQVISVVVLGMLFQFIVNKVYPYAAKEWFNIPDAKPLLLFVTGTSPLPRFYTSLIFTLWFSFGANVIIYTGAMSGVDQSVVESAQLDGVTSIQEFAFIYVPMIFSTVTTFILTGIAGLFNNQMNLHVFYAGSAEMDISVFGYFFYQMAQKNTVNDLFAESGGKEMNLRELAALGIIATAILVPVTLLTKKLLEKYGPSVD